MSEDSPVRKVDRREYYLTNRDRIRDQAKLYRETHKEEVKAYQQQYYLKKIKPFLLTRQKPVKPPKPPKPPKVPKNLPVSDSRKLPKPVYEHEEYPFGVPNDFHKRKKLLETCPLGFLEDTRENPFQMSFE